MCVERRRRRERGHPRFRVRGGRRDRPRRPGRGPRRGGRPSSRCGPRRTRRSPTSRARRCWWGMLDPYRLNGLLETWAGAGLTTFSLELLPRVTRAQAMDVLSSQSNLAGYKAVIDAGGGVRAGHAAHDDRRGHRAARPGARDGGGGGRAPGHRHRTALGRDRDRHRRAAGRARAGREPRRDLRRDREPGGGERRDRGRLRARDERRLPAAAVGALRLGAQAPGHRHRHRPGAGTARPPGSSTQGWSRPCARAR